MRRYVIVLLLLFCSVAAEYKYETKWFKVPLDHFGYQRKETFYIKYLVNDDNWDKESGPIFFYTGNEGPIELFAQHTGFMWEIAYNYRAKVVFAEHRYYGASMPFGNKSLDNEHIGYLTAAQALADYADLINYFQGDCIHPKYPVIAFGGSYGGMLAAYFRIKYPHIVAGAIAASAPVNMFPGMVSCKIYDRIVTYSFRTADEICVKNIQNSWPVLRTFLGAQNTNEWLQKQWKLCDPVKTPSDVETLVGYLRYMYETLAMVNYPYPVNFLLPLPGQPVKTVCQFLNEDLSGYKLLEGIGKVLEVYTNYTGKSKCVHYKNKDDLQNLGAYGWRYQTCTEMILPRCTTGKEDMFEPSPWNFTQDSNDCYKKYNVRPRLDVARIEYGGDRLQAASNIVFSNGLLDPWSGGGILNNISSTVQAVLLVGTAHHLDLMPSNELDPPTVKIARNFHKQNIDRWLAEYQEQN